MTRLETERLRLRRVGLEDAPFILMLVNDPDWLRFIGDRGVRTLADARGYIRSGPVKMYETFGFGLYAVEPKRGGAPIGLCGLIKRDALPEPDLGFAFLPAWRGQGYAREAALAIVEEARTTLGLPRILAITSLDNTRSIKLIERLGFIFEKVIKLSDTDPGTRLFALRLSAGSAASR